MKKPVKGGRRSQRQAPTPDLIRQYAQAMADQHQCEWQTELTDAAPHWEYLLALHLRLVELEHLDSAVQELL